MQIHLIVLLFHRGFYFHSGSGFLKKGFCDVNKVAIIQKIFSPYFAIYYVRK
jgi:hypothetical protein